MPLAALLIPLLAAHAQWGFRSWDFTGLEAFWPVYDALTSDREPQTAAWDRLFATPGYAALDARERRRASLETAMRLAFMPSRSAARDSAVRAGGFVGRATNHLRGLPGARDSVDATRAGLAQSDVLDRARLRAAAYLPPQLTEAVYPPRIALVFFLDDGRGYPDLIEADLLRMARRGVDTAYFAHELYHYFRARAGGPPWGTTLAPRDRGIVELLSYPAEEGVADQLDKRSWVEMSDRDFAALMRRSGAPAYASGYREAYRRAPEWIAAVNAALERSARTRDSASAIARVARDSLPDAGRAMGAFMARTIDSVLGRAALIETMDDALRFWLTYDDAARRSGAHRPRLSPAARRLIVELQAPR